MRIFAAHPNTSQNNISSDCVMLSKYGDVLPCIDNKYHPNPGTAEDGYSEIERTVDWLFRHDEELIQPKLHRWIATRVAQELSQSPEAPYTDVLYDVMYCDTYVPCMATRASVKKAYNDIKHGNQFNRWFGENDTKYAADIAEYVNEHFLRVRYGGKYNPNGEDVIYFRISSHGYDWRSVIEDFLWDTFGDTSKMPARVWVGHDAETNPPERTLFDGTPEEFLEYDRKIVASKLM